MRTDFCFIFMVALAHICAVCANMEKEDIKKKVTVGITKLGSLLMIVIKAISIIVSG